MPDGLLGVIQEFYQDVIVETIVCLSQPPQLSPEFIRYGRFIFSYDPRTAHVEVFVSNNNLPEIEPG